MKLPIYQIDAFTSELFGGNPAAVVVLEKWLPDHVLAVIAAENNLSETAFVIPLGQSMALRWFTPKVEVDLCGHATLATAYVLFKYYLPSTDRVVFSTRSGELSVTAQDDWLCLDFPARPAEQIPVTDVVVAALGRQPESLWRAQNLMAVFADEAEVRDLSPDFTKLAALDAPVIVTAPGQTVDFVSRFFAPTKGVPEDPVTGSAHCTLMPYWAGRLGKTQLQARQVSARGGELRCELSGARVLIAGQAVEYMRGEITVP